MLSAGEKRWENFQGTGNSTCKGPVVRESLSSGNWMKAAGWAPLSDGECEERWGVGWAGIRFKSLEGHSKCFALTSTNNRKPVKGARVMEQVEGPSGQDVGETGGGRLGCCIVGQLLSSASPSSLLPHTRGKDHGCWHLLCLICVWYKVAS